MSVTLAVSYTSRARSCACTLVELGRGDAVAAQPIDLPQNRVLDGGKGLPLGDDGVDAVEKRLLRSAAARRRRSRPARRRPARDRAARCAAGAPRRPSTRCSGRRRRSATASATSSGKKSGSENAGAWYAALQYAVVPSLRRITRRSACCWGSDLAGGARASSPARCRRSASRPASASRRYRRRRRSRASRSTARRYVR